MTVLSLGHLQPSELCRQSGCLLLKASLRYDWLGDVAIGNGEDDHIAACVVKSRIVAVSFTCKPCPLCRSDTVSCYHLAQRINASYKDSIATRVEVQSREASASAVRPRSHKASRLGKGYPVEVQYAALHVMDNIVESAHKIKYSACLNRQLYLRPANNVFSSRDSCSPCEMQSCSKRRLLFWWPM